MKTIIAPGLSTAVLSCAVASGASAQLNDTGRALIASNNLRLSADTVRSGQASTPVKEFIVPYAGVVRVKWQVKSDGAGPVTSQVVSAVDICVGGTLATTFQQKQCDLNVAAGDSIKATASGVFDDGSMMFSTASIRNVRVFYNVVNATGAGQVLSD